MLDYYGIDTREGDLVKVLGTKSTDIEKNGTKMRDMAELAEYYGLRTEVRRDMSIDDVLRFVNGGIPVILLLQAWKDFSRTAEWNDDEDDGHYVVAIGFDGDKMIFEDPSLTVRGWMSKAELEDRWHGLDDDDVTIVKHAAVVIFGEPEFDSSKKQHID